MASSYVTPTPPSTAPSQQRDGLVVEAPVSSVVVEESQQASSNKWLRILLGLALIAILIFAIVDSFTNKHVANVLHNFMEWVEEHPFQGALAVVLVYILATGTSILLNCRSWLPACGSWRRWAALVIHNLAKVS